LSDPASPFFILGSHGSGSTLLRLMLDSHERLAVPPETGVMRLVTAHAWVPYWELGGGWQERLGLSAADLDRELGEFYGGLFRRYAEQRGKARWGEKTPFHVWHIDEIRRVFPAAVFVVIVRHPLGAVASMLRRFDKDIGKATAHWMGSTREIVRQATTSDPPLCLLRYEDLARDPEGVMRELLDWLGEPWSPRVLEHHRVQGDAAKVVEGGTRPDEAVDAGRIDRWRKWFGDEERGAILDEAGPWAELLGYESDPSTGPERLTEPASDRRYVTTAAELTARRAAYPALDPTPPPRPRVDDPILPRGRRSRRRALRRAEAASGQTAREVFNRLPPGLQRGVKEARRNRRRRRSD
jgi:hypothetical protein